MSVNADELEAPQWMNKEFFERVIHHYSRDSKAEVHNFKITPGSKLGDHYASIMFRCLLSFSSKYQKSETISMIVKAMPHEAGPKKDLLEKMPFFKTEMAMYGNVLPMIESLLKSAGDNSQISPKLIYQSNDPYPVIVLEDLTLRHYETLTVQLQTYEESKIVFQRLAKFHAATYYLLKEQSIEDFDFSLYSLQDSSMVKKFVISNVETFLKELKTWPGYEIYVPKLQNLIENLYKIGQRIYSANKNGFGFNVLNHGDFHMKNILLAKNAEQKLKDLYFIDFQICVIASPAIDLIYSLHNYMNADNLKKHREEIIAYYHQEFIATLKSVGYLGETPSLQDLHAELLKNGELDVLLAIVYAVYMHLDYTKDNVMEFIDADGDLTRLMQYLYQKESYQEYIKEALPKFLHKGFI